MYTRYPFDRRGRTVSLEALEKLVAERDEFLAHAQRLQRENERLQGQLELLREDRGEYLKRAERLEEKSRRLEVEKAEALDEVQALEERLRKLEGSSQRAEQEEEKLQGLRRQVQSLNADLERIRRREGEVSESASRQERVRLLDGLGEVLDSVDRALRLGEPQGPWRTGLEGIEGQIKAFLKSQGAEVYGAVGEAMDPHYYEALAALEREGARSGEILEVERRGIRLDDGTVVRPAQVIVAR